MLSVRYCNLSSACVEVLLSKPKSGVLRVLDLSINTIEDAKLTDLNAHFGTGVCVRKNDGIASFIDFED